MKFMSGSEINDFKSNQSVHEVHGFEFPAKTIFSNNLKTIDLRVVYYSGVVSMVLWVRPNP